MDDGITESDNHRRLRQRDLVRFLFFEALKYRDQEADTECLIISRAGAEHDSQF